MLRPEMLHSLLEHTKLGLERRHLLRWLSSTSPASRVLDPKPLLYSSPNPGLTNQIFSLVGICVLANLTSARLALPRFSSGGPNVTTHPFAMLFDVAAFARVMRGTVDVIEGLPDTKHDHDSRGFGLGSDRGWFLYKAIELAFPPDCDARHDLLWQLESRVLRGLKPSAFMRHRADRLQLQLKLLPHLYPAHLGSSLGDIQQPAGFGCIHPRIERDMLKAVRFNRAGPPPPLSSYLAPVWAQRFAFIRTAQRVFVPLSLDLRRDDERRLRRPTGWNASIVRTMTLTRTSEAWAEHEAAPTAALSPASLPAASTPHTLAALLDLMICREADWFMGWSGSTYSRLLGFYQMQRHRRAHAFLVACPPPVLTCRAREQRSAAAPLLLSHSFCLDLLNLVAAENQTVDHQGQGAVQTFLRNHSVECTFAGSSSTLKSHSRSQL